MKKDPRLTEHEHVVLQWVMHIERDDSITDTAAFLQGFAPCYKAMFAQGSLHPCDMELIRRISQEKTDG